ncbi:hypothetical protein EC881467_0075 [Escherichia coli 88.1467]|nr:hypothetical protein ECPA14_5789 [Escherichia coli PA14]EIO49116.1 hypothetical protein ECPA42_0080 [Escherichia coli PA42]EKH48896.1 hypothetical protein ECFRIK1997_0082 [Escherichia coli FRIK1997]EKJ19888.1 hypothetical protein ECEC1864_0078 [Escherichia coli EC1864]EKJ47727.1 hypothetical protein ECEC1869_0079 [Escherichia coli EC1869]EKJ55061.1 hypothetical protein EC01304_5801 [Escherichia coli 0.1304]EKV88831.1 hypothetical protein EC881467_0075 [Escherichia coli 88.1467]EKW08552.1 
MKLVNFTSLFLIFVQKYNNHLLIHFLFLFFSHELYLF